MDKSFNLEEMLLECESYAENLSDAELNFIDRLYNELYSSDGNFTDKDVEELKSLYQKIGND